MLLELCLEQLVVPHELTEGNAILLDEVEICCETFAVGLRPDNRESGNQGASWRIGIMANWYPGELVSWRIGILANWHPGELVSTGITVQFSYFGNVADSVVRDDSRVIGVEGLKSRVSMNKQ